MLFADNDASNVLGFISRFYATLGVNRVEIDGAAIDSALEASRQHLDEQPGGIERASPFKKAAAFACHFVADEPIKTPLPKQSALAVGLATANAAEPSQNAVVALRIAMESLHRAKLMRSDGTECEVSRRLDLSTHSYADIVDALTQATPEHFKYVAVLLEQLAYKTNPRCQYPSHQVANFDSPECQLEQVISRDDLLDVWAGRAQLEVVKNTASPGSGYPRLALTGLWNTSHLRGGSNRDRMGSAHIALQTVCVLGLLLAGPDASAEPARNLAHEHVHPDVVLDSGTPPWAGWGAKMDASGSMPPGGVSVTEENQILVELAPDDASAANLFDLNGQTLIFTPDGRGGYSRSVRAVEWEEAIGEPVADGVEVDFESFAFDFAGRKWGSFFVSRRGLITFGQPLEFSYSDSGNRFGTMQEFARQFVTTPTISALYKPMLGGLHDLYGATQHVAQGADHLVVTWYTSDTPDFYEMGMAPEPPVSFQVVLSADGNVRFNYADVLLGDGVVGLFPDQEVEKGDLLSAIADPSDPELPGNLDLLDLAIYEATTTGVIFELTARDTTAPGQFYRLFFDVDEAHWRHDGDLGFTWGIDVGPDGNVFIWSSGLTKPSLLAIDGRRLVLLADFPGGLRASVSAGTGPIDGKWQLSDTTTTAVIQVTERSRTDLSRPGRAGVAMQSEVFHYRSIRDLDSMVCRVIDTLGDKFDLFVFHSEFRVDAQTAATPWQRYGANVNVTGLGSIGDGTAPCDSLHLKGRWVLPVWVRSDSLVNKAPSVREGPYDRGLLLFAHEFTHAWTSHGWFYLRDGERERLFGDYEPAHWRWDLHLPAAFPWRSDEPGPRSLMGGRYWGENGDGTFTLLDGYWGGGHSWLDLYAAGLADASEVPEMFILRNLQPVNRGNNRWGGRYTGDKEIVSIEQIIAAQGPRVPSAKDAQKDFNAAFVYLLEPGKTPDPDMLRLHSEFRHKALQHWFHITGGRSRMTTAVPAVGNRVPVAAGTLADTDVRAGGTVEVEMEGLFLDADGDSLTHEATSSAPAVASVTVSGGAVRVTALTAGTATITVTATDASGSNTSASLTFTVRISGSVSPLGDLNGDGRDDMLLRHRDGRWRYYPMDGQNPMRTGRGVVMLEQDTQWRLAGIGDLDGDGREDVLLRHDDGRWLGYLMDGRTVRSSASVPLPADTAWAMAGLGDLNGGRQRRRAAPQR